MGTLSLVVAIDNRQISIRSVKRFQRLPLCTHRKEVCLHQESKHSAAFDNTHATYHISTCNILEHWGGGIRKGKYLCGGELPSERGSIHCKGVNLARGIAIMQEGESP